MNTNKRTIATIELVLVVHHGAPGTSAAVITL